MKRLTVFALVLLALPGCLETDILKEEATGNFRESEFYTSGAFQDEFDLLITNVVMEYGTNPDGDSTCRPIFDVQLPPAYAARLGQAWGLMVRLTISEKRVTADKEIFETIDYSEVFKVEKRKAIVCGPKFYFDAKLQLIAPTGAITGIATRELFIPMP